MSGGTRLYTPRRTFFSRASTGKSVGQFDDRLLRREWFVRSILVSGRSPEDLAEAYPLPLLSPGTLLSRQTGWSRRTQLPLLALGPCVRVHHVHKIKHDIRFSRTRTLVLAQRSCIDAGLILSQKKKKKKKKKNKKKTRIFHVFL